MSRHYRTVLSTLCIWWISLSIFLWILNIIRVVIYGHTLGIVIMIGRNSGSESIGIKPSYLGVAPLPGRTILDHILGNDFSEFVLVVVMLAWLIAIAKYNINRKKRKL